MKEKTSLSVYRNIKVYKVIQYVNILGNFPEMDKSREDTNCYNSLKKKQKLWIYVKHIKIYMDIRKHIKRFISNFQTMNKEKPRPRWFSW